MLFVEMWVWQILIRQDEPSAGQEGGGRVPGRRTLI